MASISYLTWHPGPELSNLAFTTSLLPFRGCSLIRQSRFGRSRDVLISHVKTGEPLAVAATQTARTSSLKTAVPLPAAATHRRPPHTAHHHSVLLPCHQHPLHLHSQQAWLRTSLPTRRISHPSGRHRSSFVKRMQASSRVVTS